MKTRIKVVERPDSNGEPLTEYFPQYKGRLFWNSFVLFYPERKRHGGYKEIYYTFNSRTIDEAKSFLAAKIWKPIIYKDRFKIYRTLEDDCFLQRQWRYSRNVNERRQYYYCIGILAKGEWPPTNVFADTLEEMKSIIDGRTQVINRRTYYIE